MLPPIASLSGIHIQAIDWHASGATYLSVMSMRGESHAESIYLPVKIA
jgi:hypothetical protein